MSDPQTFEELRRMALELPKNVLVPAHHIHSLLDETERLVERSAELQRKLAEKQAEIEAMRPMVEACKARYELHLPGSYREGNPCPCLTCQWYRDYLGRKQT